MALSFQHLRAVNIARCVGGWNMPLNDWSSADWMIAVGGELGEALNVIKKLNRDAGGYVGNTRTRNELLADLADELADTVIYLDLLVASEGFTWFEQVDLIIAANPPTLSALGSDALKQAGYLAGALDFADEDTAEDIRDAADNLLHVLHEIAAAAGIDLESAVVAKFNRTSEKHGFPHRLVAS